MGVNPVTGGDGAMLIKEIREGRWKARHESLLSTPPLLLPPALAPAEAIRSLLSGKGSLPLEEDEGERRMRRRGGAPWCKARAAGSAGISRVTNARDSSRWEPLAELTALLPWLCGRALLPLEGLGAVTALQLPWDPHGRQTRK